MIPQSLGKEMDCENVMFSYIRTSNVPEKNIYLSTIRYSLLPEVLFTNRSLWRMKIKEDKGLFEYKLSFKICNSNNKMIHDRSSTVSCFVYVMYVDLYCQQCAHKVWLTSIMVLSCLTVRNSRQKPANFPTFEVKLS